MRRAVAVRRVELALLILATGCAGADAAQPTPASAPLSPPAAAPAATPPASSNPDADAVEAARPSLRACYDKARSANGGLGRTTVTLSLRVDEAGHVSTVDLDYKQRFDDASKACMRDAAFAIQLPPGQSRKVVAPVTFEPR